MSVYNFLTYSEVTSKNLNFFQGKPVICYYENLLEFYNKFLQIKSKDISDLLNANFVFAIPKITKCYKFMNFVYTTIYWYSPLEGDVQPIFSVVYNDRIKIANHMEHFYNEVTKFIKENINNSNKKLFDYANFLSNISLPTSLDKLFIVNNKLVITNWGIRDYTHPNIQISGQVSTNQNNHKEEYALSTMAGWKIIISKLKFDEHDFKKEYFSKSLSIYKEITWEKWLVLFLIFLGTITWYQASKYGTVYTKIYEKESFNKEHNESYGNNEVLENTDSEIDAQITDDPLLKKMINYSSSSINSSSNEILSETSYPASISLKFDTTYSTSSDTNILQNNGSSTLENLLLDYKNNK